jgi:hypothetical protein
MGDMIHVMLPAQYLRRPDGRISEPHRRLMAAVLQAVVDDCRGSPHRRTGGCRAPVTRRDAGKAIAYVTSTDRKWPFSFENICDALGLDADRVRGELQAIPLFALPAVVA